MEVVPGGSQMEGALEAQTDPSWELTGVSSGWVIAGRRGITEEQVLVLSEFVDMYADHLQRFSKRRSEPHVFIQMSLDGLTSVPSRNLLNQVKTVVNA
jgi:hypothetical protein